MNGLDRSAYQQFGVRRVESDEVLEVAQLGAMERPETAMN